MIKKYLLATILILLTASAQAFDFNLDFNFAGGQKKCADLLPVPGFSPTSVAFGNHSTGTTSDSVVTLANTGTAPLSAASLAVSGTSFTLQSTTCGSNPFDLAASASCTATVRFAPLTAAAFTGSLTMSAPNLDDLVASLSGTGVNFDPPTTPVISVTPEDTTNSIALTSGGVGATSYDVHWGLSSGSRGNTISSVSLPYSHTGLTNGTPYYYSLLAINGNGSAESTEASGTPAAPSVSASDDYNRANSSGLGTNWTSVTSEFSLNVSSNTAIGSHASARNANYWNATTFGNSQCSAVQVVIKDGANGPSPIVRASGSAESYYVATVQVDGTTINMSKRIAGTLSTISTWTGMSPAFSNGDTMKLCVDSGFNFTLYHDGSQVGGTISDPLSSLASGQPGVFVFSNVGVADNWAGSTP